MNGILARLETLVIFRSIAWRTSCWRSVREMSVSAGLSRFLRTRE